MPVRQGKYLALSPKQLADKLLVLEEQLKLLISIF